MNQAVQELHAAALLHCEVGFEGTSLVFVLLQEFAFEGVDLLGKAAAECWVRVDLLLRQQASCRKRIAERRPPGECCDCPEHAIDIL